MRISGRALVKRGSAKINAVQITAAATETTFIRVPFTFTYHTGTPPCVNGAEDREIERYFVEDLDRYLMDKGKAIEAIRKGIKKV